MFFVQVIAALAVVLATVLVASGRGDSLGGLPSRTPPRLPDDRAIEPADVVDLRRRVGMVFQKPNPFPKSIFDNVAFGPRLHMRISPSGLADLVEWALKKAAVWIGMAALPSSRRLDHSLAPDQRMKSGEVLRRRTWCNFPGCEPFPTLDP